MEGLAIFCYENGKIREKANWKNGKEEFKIYFYNNNDDLYRIETYSAESLFI